jgi:hypothetical protein
MTEYNNGGFIAGEPVLVRIDPDECLIRAEDVKAGRIRCGRAGHPTATSDCAAKR